MKIKIAILMAVMLFSMILTACNGTMGMDNDPAYGNVSEAPGTDIHGQNSRSNYTPSVGNNYGQYNQNSTSSYGGNPQYRGQGSSGTGMTGGR